jgi:large subunit ribosomal protein L15
MHGFGNTQKHRGAGSRGGRGMAGSKKQRWQYVSKYLPGYFGRRGFKKKGEVQCDITINVGEIEAILDALVKEGKAKGGKGAYSVDLAAAGFTKLLGTGKVASKLTVTVASCSAKAKEKIEAAGGSIEGQEESESEDTGD